MPPSTPSGVMICLPLPEVVARSIVLEGGEPVESLHVTLGYIPGIGGDWEKKKALMAAISPLATTLAPIRGQIGGTGRFNGSATSDFKDVFYMSFDSPGLEKLRAAVLDAVEKAGFEVSKKHGFTPHITLKYLDSEEASPPANPFGLPAFDVDQLALGDRDGMFVFEFTGVVVLKGSPTSSDVHVDVPMGGKKKKQKKADDEGKDEAAAPAVATPHIEEPGAEIPPEDNLDVGYSPKYAEDLAEAAISACHSQRATDLATVMLKKCLEPEDGFIRISKLAPKKQIAYGVVLEPETEDLQGDSISEEEIEKTAHGYLENARNVHERHRSKTEAFPVESYIAPQDLIFRGGPHGDQHVLKGSWVLGVKVNDPEVWRKIETGEYNGFSVGGMGVRDPI